MTNLNNKKCKPCEGGIPPLNEEEINKLLKEIGGWNVVNNEKIEKEFKFKNFKESLEFTNKVGELAENDNHHPDIFIHRFKNVKITLSTHAISGLSENDFILASKIDLLR